MNALLCLSSATLVGTAAGPLASTVGADVTFGGEKPMAKHQEFMKGVVFRAASSATLMAVVVVVVGAGRKFV